MDFFDGLGFLAVLTAFIFAVVAIQRANRADHGVRRLLDRLDALERAVARLDPARESPASAPDPVAPQVRLQQPVALPPPPPSPSAPVPVPAVPGARVETEDLEQLIGGRWLLYAGVAAVVLGMSYFVKFAFDNGWISEQLRVAVGVAAGALLVTAGIRFWSRGLALFGQALAGGGIVVFYVSIYAALHFYQLITQAPAFALMVVVTAAAAWLADRQRSQPMAALALLGGFATPQLVGGERNAQIVLFTYLAILVSGTAVIARRHAWPLLGAASYICTFVLVVAWFFSSYRAGLWLQTELFLTLYAALFGYLLWALLRSGDRSPQRHLAVAALVTAPLAYHFGSLILLSERPGPWLVYLVAITVAGLIVSQRTRAAWLRVTVLVLVGLPFVAWLQFLDYPRWYAASVVTACVLYVLHLAAQREAGGEEGSGDRTPVMQVVHAQVNGLMLPLSLYVFIEPRYAAWNPWMVAALAAWNASLAWMARARAPRLVLSFVALSATLAAVAVVLAVDGPAVAVGWAAEGVFLGWLALRERSRSLGLGSATLIAMGGLRIAGLLLQPLAVTAQPLFNARTLAAAVVIGLFAWLAWRLRGDEAPAVRGEARNALIIVANQLAPGLLSADIQAWFVGRALDAHGAGDARAAGAAGLAGQVTLSVAWALYAVSLIAVGIRRRYAPARYLAILLFGVTVLKVLAQDIAGLDRLNRMLSVLGVGVLLLVASYLYQRMAMRARDERT